MPPEHFRNGRAVNTVLLRTQVRLRHCHSALVVVVVEESVVQGEGQR
jgi:hypothetical protein